MSIVSNNFEPVFQHPGFNIYGKIFEDIEIFSCMIKEPWLACNECYLPIAKLETVGYIQATPCNKYLDCLRCRGKYCDINCMEFDETYTQIACRKFVAKVKQGALPSTTWQECSKLMIFEKFKFLYQVVLKNQAKIMGNRHSFRDLDRHPNGKANELFRNFKVFGQNACVYYGIELDDILRLYSNSITFYGLEPNGITFGIAYNIDSTIFKHSCKPNSIVVKTDSKIRIIALRKIEPNEPITIGRYNIFQPCYIRRQIVKDFTGYPCKCEECNHYSVNQNEYRKESAQYQHKYGNRDGQIVALNEEFLEYKNMTLENLGGNCNEELNNLFKLTNSIITRFERLFPGPHPLKVYILIKSFKFIFRCYKSLQLQGYYTSLLIYLHHSICLLYGGSSSVLKHFVYLLSEEECLQVFNRSRVELYSDHNPRTYTEADHHLFMIEHIFNDHVPDDDEVIDFQPHRIYDGDEYPFHGHDFTLDEWRKWKGVEDAAVDQLVQQNN